MRRQRSRPTPLRSRLSRPRPQQSGPACGRKDLGPLVPIRPTIWRHFASRPSRIEGRNSHNPPQRPWALVHSLLERTAVWRQNLVILGRNEVAQAVCTRFWGKCVLGRFLCSTTQGRRAGPDGPGGAGPCGDGGPAHWAAVVRHSPQWPVPSRGHELEKRVRPVLRLSPVCRKRLHMIRLR